MAGLERMTTGTAVSALPNLATQVDTRYIMPIIVSNCQHCDKQQFQTLSCVHYTIFSVIKLDLFIRALLLDRILSLEKLRVRLAYILFTIQLSVQSFLTNMNPYTVGEQKRFLSSRKILSIVIMWYWLQYCSVVTL